MPECRFPTCTRNAEKNGMCIGHRIYSDSVEVKVQEEIPKESKKEKELKKSRKVRYAEFIKANPKCLAKFSKQCQKIATIIHHLKGRTPAVVDEEKFWLPCCPICNGEIETRHADAEKLGLKISQHKKQQ